MSRSVQNQEEQIRQVQALVFEGIGSDSWAAGDDGTVRADLENLHSRLKSWAKKYAIEDMREIRKLVAEEYNTFIQLLAEVVHLNSGVSSPIEHLESPLMNKKSPAMCIQGLLAHHVYSRVISQPFFVFGDGATLLQSIFKQIQQGMWDTLRCIDQNESHMLRSRTLRLLATPPPSANQGNGTHDSYRALQKATCRELAGVFYNSPARHLIKPASRADGEAASHCFNDLESIMQYAGELSHRLWSRRTTLRVRTLHDLRETPFREGFEYMRAHPLHRLYEDDDRCDGWFASVVTHPAVVGLGSSDGKDYSTPRVWIKAEVWLAEDAANGAARGGEESRVYK
ncbi:hypothetical protein MYCTH_2062435 [Thermothelomyces thermophilus ATCC 42464]|uniref:Uncharacterized protein n=1 Tax=Thermothelomyces thermophilus (strain ATCC 42464 / BCRC 31852 / DSM 1799) TaxID=573729 RepID=G2QBF2_THET4|nr:uncharacterized protein MYCTH_2062435 [Thermothelomyces thermophilus ATCC 42464]AEO57895.1 hypothetical protein MYCTH_2062435 [Thermothelomyces thermophilus ATCC 42464]